MFDLINRAQQLFISSSSRDSSISLKSPKRQSSFRQHYGLGKVLGKGTYSVVRKGVDLRTNQRVAVKCIDEADLSEKDAKALQREVQLLRKLHHPNIIEFKQFYYEEPERMYYIVTEYCNGGELFDAILQKVFYQEEEARRIVLTLTKAIKFMHDRNIVHRDLKPENILLEERKANGDFEVDKLKIADFGFAKYLKTNVGLTTICGSPIYVAPEIISRNQYGKGVDVWSLGVISYILLCGYPPFNDTNTEVLFGKIREGRFTFDRQHWGNVSNGAKDVIASMLSVNPKKRLTIEEVLDHPWLSLTVNKTNRVEVEPEAAAASPGGKGDITPALEEMKKQHWRLPINAVKVVNRFRYSSESGSN